MWQKTERGAVWRHCHLGRELGNNYQTSLLCYLNQGALHSQMQQKQPVDLVPTVSTWGSEWTQVLSGSRHTNRRYSLDIWAETWRRKVINTWRRTFQAEGRAWAKAPRWEWAWNIYATAAGLRSGSRVNPCGWNQKVTGVPGWLSRLLNEIRIPGWGLTEEGHALADVLTGPIWGQRWRLEGKGWSHATPR